MLKCFSTEEFLSIDENDDVVFQKMSKVADEETEEEKKEKVGDK